MINISRERYVITRQHNDKLQVYGGLARNYKFVDIDDIKDTPIKTYMSESKALSAYMRSWYGAKEDDVVIVPVNESIIEIGD